MSDWLNLLIRFFDDFLVGAGVTLELTAIGLAMGFLLGLGLALAKVYGAKPTSSSTPPQH